MNKIKCKLFCFSWIGGLSFLAGAINVCGIVIFGVTISHSTGNISKAGIALGNGEIFKFMTNLSYIFFFFLGSTLSGIIQDNKSLLKKYYVIFPILFGIIIYTMSKMNQNNVAILNTISFMVGAQNGTYLEIHGIKVRTTHITGYLTDAGSSLGALLHGNLEEFHKLKFYLISIVVFFSGCVVSTILISKIGESRTIEIFATLYIAIGIDIALGFATGIANEYIPKNYITLK